MMRRTHRIPMFSHSFASSLFILVCCQLALISVRADGSYSHTIAYNDEECILIRIPKDQTHVIRGSFDILDSSVPPDPVRVALYNSDENLIWSSNYGDTEGSFSRGGAGRMWLCLENGLTYERTLHSIPDPRMRVERTFGFSIRVKKPTVVVREMLKREVSAAEGAGGEDDVHIGDVDDAMTSLVELADELNENFDALADHMSFMKAREMVHRELHEETFTKVVRWNILEICTVVAVTFGQVLNVWWIMSKAAKTRYY